MNKDVSIAIISTTLIWQFIAIGLKLSEILTWNWWFVSLPVLVVAGLLLLSFIGYGALLLWLKKKGYHKNGFGGFEHKKNKLGESEYRK